jgi:hypothetical protein
VGSESSATPCAAAATDKLPDIQVYDWRRAADSELWFRCSTGTHAVPRGYRSLGVKSTTSRAMSSRAVPAPGERGGTDVHAHGDPGGTTGIEKQGVLSSLDGNALSIRRVAPADLAAARVWIDNWQRMPPYVVANRGLIPPTLSEAIVRFVAAPQRLLAIERVRPAIRFCAVRRCSACCAAGGSRHRSFAPNRYLC